MKIATYCLILFAICIPAYSQRKGKEWKLVSTGVDATEYYVNMNEISITKTKTKTTWVKSQEPFDFYGLEVELAKTGSKEVSKPDPDTYYSHTMSLYEFNCREKKYRTLSVIEYAVSGKVLRSIDNRSSWIYAIPDSVGYALLKHTCEYKK